MSAITWKVEGNVHSVEQGDLKATVAQHKSNVCVLKVIEKYAIIFNGVVTFEDGLAASKAIIETLLSAKASVTKKP